MRIRLPLSWRTRNYVGTIFGGSLYGALDPIYMIQLLQRLGPGHVVWDKAATIRFLKPGRETLFATFRLEQAELEGIRAEVAAVGKCEREFVVELTSSSGEAHVQCRKLLHIRRREG